ncbi:CoA transferase [Rhodococcus sp. 14C212]|uniref:CaiB/BaiF CoA transferase family protein n=1 Tax=Rhodococcus sp. 14C212 TaxID=2711209 RepID=UPI0013EC7D4B|nr:CoA transferase [Rhodococcus sp. 14C212]NGP07387.1 CoA transferase [Rhodococcus sp. 14C212]
MTSMHTGRRPLEGLIVVEVASYHAVPGAGATLADLGATVIKVENPQGSPERFAKRDGTDPLRSASVNDDEWSLLWDFANRSKRVISLDLKQPEAQQILHRLVENADVFLTNTPVRARAGIATGYERLREVNPQLVYCSLTAFGSEGPMAAQPGFDSLAQAVSGMMMATGQDEPHQLGLILLDHLSTIAVTAAVTTALVTRQLQGIGQEVHVSLLGAATWVMQTNLLSSSVNGAPVDLSYDRIRNSPNATTYRAGDGKWIILVNVPEAKNFAKLCAAVGHPEIAEDSRFATTESRRAHRGELFAALDSAFAKRPRSEWLELLAQERIMVAPVNDLFDVLDDPQILANDYVVQMDHPRLGRIRTPQLPLRFGVSAPPQAAPAPQAIGENTAAVLRDYGWDDETITDLRARGVIR